MTTSVTSCSPIGDLLVSSATGPNGIHNAITAGGEELTYQELLAESVAISRAIIASGVRSRERVGILGLNSMEWFSAFFGVTLAGCTAVPINARYASAEMAYVISDSDVRLILVSDAGIDAVDLWDRLAKAGVDTSLEPSELSRTVGRRSVGAAFVGKATERSTASFSELLALGSDVSLELATSRRWGVRIRDVAVVLYTSGTTAHPKGCMLTHESLSRNADGLSDRFELTTKDVFWNPLPMFHAGGIVPLLACMKVPCSLVTSPYFDAQTAVESIQQSKASVVFSGFPAVTQSLVDVAQAISLDHVRILLTTGSEEFLKRIQSSLPGCKQISTYGLTEAGGAICYSNLNDPPDVRASTCGKPFDGVEIEIAPIGTTDKNETEEEDQFTDVGEILVRGYCLMERYVGVSPLDVDTIDEAGWLHTGDIGSVDADGRVVFLGRLKDMLKVGGENVAAAEIENVLLQNPAIRMVQAVPAPDERLGEVPAVFVELRSGGSPLTEEDVIRYCAERLASFKVPRYVRFIEDWPMSATKIQKFRLRERLESELWEKGMRDQEGERTEDWK